MTTEQTIEGYLAKLPVDRKAALDAVRFVIDAHLPDGYETGILYGMPSWYVPLATLPDTYNGQPLALASLASQKSGMALHLPCAYIDPSLRTWLEGAFAKTGKKLDMGKGCLRFETLDALPLDVIGALIDKVPVATYVDAYRAAYADRGAKKGAAKKKPAKKKPAKKASAKKPAKKSAKKR